MTRLAVVFLTSLALAACGTVRDFTEREAEGPPRKERVFAVTESNKLIAFNAGQPRKAAVVGTIAGMQPNETLLGIDFRVARGILYGIGSSGRLYTIDTRTAEARAVGAGQPIGFQFSGNEFGFDFNPVVDRIRFVSDTGQNMRLHPDTGVAVDGNPGEEGVQMDGALAYAPREPDVDGRRPRVVAAAYTYNKTNDKITTNYAIDAQHGALVTQGTKEGAAQAVSPNTGQLFRVGSLGISSFSKAHFDIADVTGAAFAAFDIGRASRFYLIDLDTGAATFIGTIGGGEKVRGISVEP